MELSQIFGIDEPLCSESAERIYEKANEVLQSINVSSLLKKFKVEYIATTDDPIDTLDRHGVHGDTLVSPTFRPDKIYGLDSEYIKKLGDAAGVTVETLDDLLFALEKRLDFFVSKGCKISDHGFERFPKSYATKAEADALFAGRNSLTESEKDSLFGFILVWLAKEYGKRGMLMQIHFSVIRNNNPKMFALLGVDTGFDLIGEPQSVKDAVSFFARISDEERPETVLYTLNDSNLASLASITGAFRKVKMGAAWWFNDTVEGIRKNLSTIAEYSAIGTNLGMLTDSRSFSSYVRFDFFRRILADYLGNFVKKGEYDLTSAIATAKNICYSNIKNILNKEALK
jgi:glucuronate isomerase